MSDRLQYAAIGAFVGFFLGLFVWFLFDPGAGRFSSAWMGRDVRVVLAWCVPLCAFLGFILKDRAGSVVGWVMDEVLSSRNDGLLGIDERQLPTWLTVTVLLAVAAGVLIYVL